MGLSARETVFTGLWDLGGTGGAAVFAGGTGNIGAYARLSGGTGLDGAGGDAYVSGGQGSTVNGSVYIGDSFTVAVHLGTGAIPVYIDGTVGAEVTLNPGSTPQTALLLDIAAPAENAYKASHTLVQRAHYYPTAGADHTLDLVQQMVVWDTTSSFAASWSALLDGVTPYPLFTAGVTIGDPTAKLKLGGWNHWAIELDDRTGDGTGKSLHVRAGQHIGAHPDGTLYLGDAKTGAVSIGAASITTTIAGGLVFSETGGQALTVGAVPDGYLFKRVGTTVVGLDPSSISPDLSGYALLAGRAGGQTLAGGNAVNDSLVLKSTSFASPSTTDYISLCVGTEAVRVIHDGKVGIGVAAPVSHFEVPGCTTNSSAKFGALEFQSYAVNNNWFGDNLYYDGGNNRYRSNGYASLFQFGYPSGGDLTIRSAGFGTAGAVMTVVDGVTFKQSGKVGIGVVAPGQLLSLQQAGTATADTDIFSLTNSGNAAAMTNTRTSILFRQYYYNAATPAAVDAGRITVGTETDWTSTASTQDAYMAFGVAVDGVVTQKMKIPASAAISIGAGYTGGVAGDLSIGRNTAGYMYFGSAGTGYIGFNGSSFASSTGFSATGALATSGSSAGIEVYSRAGGSHWTLYGAGTELNFNTSVDGGNKMVLSAAGLLTLNPGTTPSNALLLDIAAPAAGGGETLVNSHAIDLRARMHTAGDVQHYSDWRIYGTPIRDPSGGSLLFRSSLDGGTESTILTLSTAGAVTVADDYETTTAGKGYILKSPDGTRYRLSVANGGAVSAVAA